MGSHEAADEAAQEAILRAWRHRDSCRRPEEPHGWLRRIAHNEAVRVATRRPDEVLVDEPLARPDGSAAADDELESRLEIRALLATLSPADQELARLRYFEDLTCANLADHFGTNEATVKVRLHRMRRRLRKTMEAQV